MPDRGSITVSELNLLVAEAIRREPRIHSLTVNGEISGFKHHIASGHWYFILKDAESSVNCVMFRTNTLKAQIRPKDGQQVLVTGYVDVYPRDGRYQLYVTGMRDAGAGDMYARFEELKRRLYAEGLFDPARKKPLPMVPRKVAVVTSGSGAALHDILNVSGARCPSVPVVLVPTTVQGEKASEEIARNIRKAAEETDADVIIVARGGGSAEDLWCFNAEEVARAVAECPIPVVSGVGHEIDTTICDLAADVRAATPSNAAEIVFPDRKELMGRTKSLRILLFRGAREQILERERALRAAAVRLNALSPGIRISGLSARTRMLREALRHAAKARTEEQYGTIRIIRSTLDHAVTRKVESAGMDTRRLRERLEAINPMNVLDRGYALVYAEDGRILTRKKYAESAKKLDVRFADGKVHTEVVPAGRQENE